MDGLLITAAIILLGPWVLAGVALARANAAWREAAQAQTALAALARQITEPGGAPVVGDRPPEPPVVPDTDAEAPTAPEQQAGDMAADQPPAAAPPSYARPWDRAPTPANDEPGDGQPAASPAAAARSGVQSFEEALTSRWMVWLGAVVTALGSVFLVKFAVDQGILGPAARDSLAFLFGVALVGGGECLRRRPLQRQIAAIRTDYVPLALTAAGLFAAFASVFAAHQLHGLLPPLIAFAGFAAIAFVAIGLSLLQGKFVALLGLLGGFATPQLVGTPDPSLWGLFSYLLIIQAACLTLVRYQRWWSLGYATLASAAAWPVLVWPHLTWSDAQITPLGVYLMLTAGAFFVLRHQVRGSDLTLARDNWLQYFIAEKPAETLAWLAALSVAALTYGVVVAADFSVVALVLLAGLAALYLVVARVTPMLEHLTIVAAAMTVFAIVSWLPSFATGEENAFIYASIGLGALFGIGGFIALWGAERPALWAAVSISVPLALYIAAFGNIAGFEADRTWIALAIGLGAISLAATARVVVHRSAFGLSVSLGFYAAGVAAFTSLAMTMILEQAWLTVALSLQVLAIAWIHERVPERALRIVAAIIAGTVLTRLVANPNVLDYALIGTPVLSWTLYGYGVPALAFFGATRFFRRSSEPLVAPLVSLLQAGYIAFGVLLVSSQIRLFVAGSLDGTHYSLLEQSLQAIVWLSVGGALQLRHRRHPNPIYHYGSLALLALAGAQIVFSHVLFSNPIWTGEFVGDYPLFNTLVLAYAVPAAFAFLAAWRLPAGKPAWLATAAGGLGFALLFVYLSLEVRRAFQGPVFEALPQSDAEFYAYSLVWLVYALVLLGLAIATRWTLPRYASLAVLLLTVLKAFLFDMADLSGLLRVSTFMILGLTLVGIGYVYQRYVFRLPGPAVPQNSAVAGDG